MSGTRQRPSDDRIRMRVPARAGACARLRLHAKLVCALACVVAITAPAGTAAAAPTTTTTPPTGLSVRLDRIIAASGVARTTSVYVWDQQSREVLYSRGASRRVTPASTMKLLTSAAALSKWGGEHRFRTTLLATGRQEGSTWLGSIYLVGGGDPMLSTAGFARDNYGGYGRGTNVASLASGLRKLGIRTVSGRLVVDDDHLDARRWVNEWPRRFRLDETGALGGLTVNQSQLGRYIGGRSTAYPDLHAGTQLRGVMQRLGISVSGATVAGSAPTSATELAHVDSPPLVDIVRHMNTTSDNFVAETLLKDLGATATGGRGGSTVTGRRVAARELRRLGVDTSALTWTDGSGLAYTNRVTARLLGQVLGISAQAEWGPAWVDGFAIAGRTGTLRRRMTTWPFRDRVRGKTGTLRHVSALAGFSDRLGSTSRYGFAVVTNNANGQLVSYSHAKRLQDRVAMALVR